MKASTGRAPSPPTPAEASSCCSCWAGSSAAGPANCNTPARAKPATAACCPTRRCKHARPRSATWAAVAANTSTPVVAVGVSGCSWRRSKSGSSRGFFSSGGPANQCCRKARIWSGWRRASQWAAMASKAGRGAGTDRQDLAQPLPGLPQLAEGMLPTSRQAPDQGAPGGRWRFAAVPEQVMPTPLQQAPGGILGQGCRGGGVGHRHHPIHSQGLPQQLARRLPRPLNPDPRPLQQGVMAAGGPAL